MSELSHCRKPRSRMQCQSSHCHATNARHLYLRLALPSHYTKIMSCHYCKSHRWEIMRTSSPPCTSIALQLLSQPCCHPWIFLVVGLPFTSDFHPRIVANSSRNRNCAIVVVASEDFSFYRCSLHCRYC